MKTILAIFVGGAFGTLFRYTVNEYTLVTGYPLGTVIENIFGSFLLGLLTGWFVYKSTKEWVKAGLGVGLCGGFTTMSTLAADSLFLFEVSGVYSSLLYIVISLFGGIILAAVGSLLGEKLGRSRERVKLVE